MNVYKCIYIYIYKSFMTSVNGYCSDMFFFDIYISFWVFPHNSYVFNVPSRKRFSQYAKGKQCIKSGRRKIKRKSALGT